MAVRNRNPPRPRAAGAPGWSVVERTRRDDGYEAGGARGSGDRPNGGAGVRGEDAASTRTRRGARSGSGAAAGRNPVPGRSASGRGEAGRAEAARHAAPGDDLSPREAGMRMGTAPATSAASSSARRKRGPGPRTRVGHGAESTRMPRGRTASPAHPPRPVGRMRGQGRARSLQQTPRSCVRDARPQGRDTGADARAPRKRAAAGERRGLGAVGNSRIVAYGARSPTRSAAEGHARKSSALVWKCVSAEVDADSSHTPIHALPHSRTPALPHSRTPALTHSRTG